MVLGAKWKCSSHLVAWFLLYELQNDGKGSEMWQIKLKKEIIELHKSKQG